MIEVMAAKATIRIWRLIGLFREAGHVGANPPVQEPLADGTGKGE